jgi:hypothetical protein
MSPTELPPDEDGSDEAHVSPTESPPYEDGSDEAHVAISEDFDVFLLRPKGASEAQHDKIQTLKSCLR